MIMKLLRTAAPILYPTILTGGIVYCSSLSAESTQELPPSMPSPGDEAPKVQFSIDDDGVPLRTSRHFFSRNADCPSAKIDLWLSKGAVSFVTFLGGHGGSQISHETDEEKKSTILIGNPGCKFKLTIEGLKN